MRSVYCCCILLLSFGVNASELLTDPTKPFFSATSVVSSKAEQSLKLNSVVVRKRSQIAIINGQRVTVGDSIGGAKVVAISKQGVKLQRADKEIMLSIAERSGFSKKMSGK